MTAFAHRFLVVYKILAYERIGIRQTKNTKTSMKIKSLFIAAIFSFWATAGWAATTDEADEPHQPHTPTLIFYLSGAHGQKDVDAIRVSVQKLKSATTVAVNTNRSYARIRFDSHVVSY